MTSSAFAKTLPGAKSRNLPTSMLGAYVSEILPVTRPTESKAVKAIGAKSPLSDECALS